jgi:hypothetical protein
MSPRAGSYDSARSSYLPPVEGGREGGGGDGTDGKRARW